MNLVEHAKREFEILGWPGDSESQRWICDNLIALLDTFSSQGHSGSSAPYVVNLFDKLAAHQTISPLTGKDDEWNDVGQQAGYPLYQNKRDSEVFKHNGKAYWIAGRVFEDKDGGRYTNKESRVHVIFPWTRPEPETIQRGR